MRVHHLNIKSCFKLSYLYHYMCSVQMHHAYYSYSLFSNLFSHMYTYWPSKQSKICHKFFINLDASSFKVNNKKLDSSTWVIRLKRLKNAFEMVTWNKKMIYFLILLANWTWVEYRIYLNLQLKLKEKYDAYSTWSQPSEALFFNSSEVSKDFSHQSKCYHVFFEIIVQVRVSVEPNLFCHHFKSTQ